MEFFKYVEQALSRIAKEKALKLVKAKYDGKCVVEGILGIEGFEVNLSLTDSIASISIVDDIKKEFARETGKEESKLHGKLLTFFTDLIKEEKDV